MKNNFLKQTVLIFLIFAFIIFYLPVANISANLIHTTNAKIYEKQNKSNVEKSAIDGLTQTSTKSNTELISKNIEIVIAGADKTIHYMTINGHINQEFIINTPNIYLNHAFSSFYTEAGEIKSYTLGDTLLLKNSDTIYLHYDKISTSFNLIIKDSINNIEYGKIPIEANVGDTVNISSSEIRSAISNLENERAYKNYKILNQSKSINVSKDMQDQVIELIPRTKTVLYVGYNFANVINTSNTSGSAIKSTSSQITKIAQYTYDGKNMTYDIDYNFDDYTFLSSSYSSDTLDFSNKFDNIVLSFYKGERPDDGSDEYDYSINAQYIDTYTGSYVPTLVSLNANPYKLYTSIYDLLPFQIYEYEDYEISSIDIKSGGVKYSYNTNENFYEHLPQINNNELTYNSYSATVNYNPYTTITLNQYIEDLDGNYNLIDSKTTLDLYSNTVTFDKPVSNYELELISFDDGVIPNNDGSISVEINELAKTLNVYYRPSVYNLNVVLKLDEDNSSVYSFNNININDTTSFLLPKIDNYLYKSADINNSNISISENNNIVYFNPNGQSGEYTIYLAYNKQYKVIMNVDNADLGTIYTNSTDNLFFENETVFISAVPNNGFSFSKWVSSDVIINNSTLKESSFIMPKGDVYIEAIFVADNSNEVVEPEPEPKPEPEPEPDIPTPEPLPDISDSSSDNNTSKIDITEYLFEDSLAEIELLPIDTIVDIPQKPNNSNSKENISLLINNPVSIAIRQHDPYIKSYSNDSINPNGDMTRAEVMDIIYNLYGMGEYRDSYSDKSSISYFSDVSNDEWYSDSIAFCVDYGITKGYGDGTMKPNQLVTRAELATILSNFIELETNSTSTLSDTSFSWAENSINTLCNHNIINGYPDGTFKPNQTTTRSEFTKMINRLVKRSDTYYTNYKFYDLPQNHWAYDEMMNATNGAVVSSDISKQLLDKIEIYKKY